MPVIEMDPLLVLKAIEGYENELDPEIKKLDAFYRQFSCPRCSGSVQKEILAGENGGHAFADKGTLVARSVLRCTACSCLFDPHTGMILERGAHPNVAPVQIDPLKTR